MKFHLYDLFLLQLFFSFFFLMSFNYYSLQRKCTFFSQDFFVSFAFPRTGNNYSNFSCVSGYARKEPAVFKANSKG